MKTPPSDPKESPPGSRAERPTTMPARSQAAMPAGREPGHLPPLAIELLLAGAAPGDSGRRWQQHLAGCSSCGKHLAEARALGEGWQRSPEADRLRGLLASAPTDARRTDTGKIGKIGERARRWWLAGLALPAAALAVWVWIAPTGPSTPLEPFAAKGSGMLGVTVEHAGRRTNWPSGQARTTALSPGDRVQLTWSSLRPGHLAVLARDSDGDVHRLFPQAGSDSASLAPGAARALGSSLLVEPGFRRLRVWSVFAETAFAIAPLLEQLRVRGALSGENGQQVSFFDLSTGSAPGR